MRPVRARIRTIKPIHIQIMCQGSKRKGETAAIAMVSPVHTSAAVGREEAGEPLRVDDRQRPLQRGATPQHLLK